MPAYDKSTIAGYLATWDDITLSHAVRGKAFEELACYLFSNIPGVSIISRNAKNTFATEEIDIACLHTQDPTGLQFLNPFFLAECKGWSNPVSSVEVAWFLFKIEHRGLDFGVLFAANGITGIAEHLTAAHSIVSFALSSKQIRLVIITHAEIEALNSGEELAS
jgi:hypothetical protein